MQMPTENWRFGGGLSETLLHPAAAVAMVVVIVLMLVLPRKYVLVPFLCGALLIPLGQELVVAGVHLFVVRIIILFAWIRVLIAKLVRKAEIASNGYNTADKVLTLWAIFRASAFMLLYLASAAVINQFGFLLDALGGYFLLRFLIRDDEDINRAIRALAVIAAIVAVGMLNEKLRYVNPFGLIGGVHLIPQYREGSIRAQGPFQHPILAGTFGATLLPLFFSLWKFARSRFVAITGVIASTIMVLTAASSTPLLAYAAGVGAIGLWPFRKRMRTIRWGIVVAVLALQLGMKAPFWFLIAHVDLVGGSSGYHRAMLVDQFIRGFGSWWLIGTNSNQDWGFDMWDLSNQFVAEGETGGLATFVCFLAVISLCFSRLGRARKAIEGDRKQEWFLWCLGATLFSHVVAFFGISYFDQTRVAWFALLAVISAATTSRIAETTCAVEQRPAQDQLLIAG